MSEHELLLTALGIIGVLTSSIRGIPQAVRAIRLRPDELRGVSAGTWAMSLVSCLLWIVWSFGIGQPLAGVSSLIAAPAALVVIMRLRRR